MSSRGGTGRLADAAEKYERAVNTNTSLKNAIASKNTQIDEYQKHISELEKGIKASELKESELKSQLESGPENPIDQIKELERELYDKLTNVSKE